jgi:glycosyltransferase involved in cell wall biosynthesis
MIEFRALDSLGFLVKNIIHKLGAVKIYFVHGLDNADIVQGLAHHIPTVCPIQFMVLNQTVDQYNCLVSSSEFWDHFTEEHLLVCQEDSAVYGGVVSEWFEYGYVGAPWPRSNHVNQANVGNGGFSLRRLSVMRYITANYPNDHTNPYICVQPSTRDGIRDSNLSCVPEDVYFTQTMLGCDMGIFAPHGVAPYDIARRFSQEQVISPPDVFGAHCPWLAYPQGTTYWLAIQTIRLFDTAVIVTPYQYTRGGGEKYVADLARHFIGLNVVVLLFCTSPPATVYQTLGLYLEPTLLQYIRVYGFDTIRCIEFRVSVRPKYFVLVGHHAAPVCEGLGQTNLYHCQFPFDTHEITASYERLFGRATIRMMLASYDRVIVNSEFTRDAIATIYREWLGMRRHTIEVLYPAAIRRDQLVKQEHTKQPNSFVMVGRILPHNEMSNNKFFDVAISVFRRIADNMPNTPYSLVIIGSCKSPEYLAQLRESIGSLGSNQHIQILDDLDDLGKFTVLEKSQYYVLLTGIGDTRPANQEHFGISLIEALGCQCVPICYEGGYPARILPPNHLVKDADHLYQMVAGILGGEYVLEYPEIDLERYTNDVFDATLGKLLAM